MSVRAIGWRAAAAALVVVAVAVVATVVGAAPITSAGPLTSIDIGTVLNCTVNYTGDASPEWFDSTACGTFVAFGGNIYGPGSIPAGGSLTGLGNYVAFTAVSQSPVTGAGTAGSPYQVVTVVDLGATGLRLTQTDTYVTGRATYNTADVLANTTDSPLGGAVIFRAGDCYLQDSDTGLGHVDGGAITCKARADSDNPNRVEQLYPVTPGSSYLESTYNTVWTTVGLGVALPDTCLCDQTVDNGIALSWSIAPFVAHSQATISSGTAFSPVGSLPITTTKTADASTATAGAADGYTITFTNPGAVAATLTSITDDLPAGFTYTAGSSSGVTTSDPAIAANVLTWTGSFGVPADGTASLHFGVHVAGSPGTYTNSATADGDGLTVLGVTDTAPITVTGTGTTTTTTTGSTTTSTTSPSTTSTTTTSTSTTMPTGSTTTSTTQPGTITTGSIVVVTTTAPTTTTTTASTSTLPPTTVTEPVTTPTEPVTATTQPSLVVPTTGGAVAGTGTVASPSTGGELARTGTNTRQPLELAGGLVALGLGLTLLARRRLRT